jgi:DNA-binding response OmpR family regulator
LIISTRAELAALGGGASATPVELQVTADAAEVDRILRRRRPGAVVLDLELSEVQLFLEQLKRRPELAGVTLVGMSSQLSPARRIELAQRGVSCFVSNGVGLDELLAACAPSPLAPVVKVGRALLLSEDAPLSRSLGTTLDALGIALDVCADRAQLSAALEQQLTDLVLLDAAGLAGDAVDLARELRASARTLGASLMVLAPCPDAELRRRAIEAGVDEVLPRDEPAVVLSRLRQRAAVALSLLERVATYPASDAARALPELPAAPGALTPAPDISDPVRVLVADDDPALRDLIRAHLERLGWQVVLAADGEQAERALTEQAFHIALLDVLMPFRSGFDLLEWVNANRDHRPLKIVILTALGQDENLLRAFDLGADDFIAKPVSADAIVGRLRRLLRPA